MDDAFNLLVFEIMLCSTMHGRACCWRKLRIKEDEHGTVTMYKKSILPKMCCSIIVFMSVKWLFRHTLVIVLCRGKSQAGYQYDTTQLLSCKLCPGDITNSLNSRGYATIHRRGRNFIDVLRTMNQCSEVKK